MTWGVRMVGQKIRDMQDSDNDIILVISGYRGVGKSTFALAVAHELIGDKYYTKQGFEKHNIYARHELDKKLEEFPPESVLVVDEAINLMFKREFQNRQQNLIIKKFNTYRNKKYCIMLLIPNYWDLDRSIRNSSMIKWWIHLSKRGRGYIYHTEDNEFNPDPWNQKDNMIRLRQGTKRYSLRNYVKDVSWPKLNGSVFAKYEEVKGVKRKASYEDEKIKKK